MKIIIPILLKKRNKRMKEPHHQTPLSEVLNMLREKGFTDDFVMEDKGIKNKSSGEAYQAEDLTIVKVYRFEGESDPADMSVVYAMKSKRGDKGIFLDAFGTYADYDGQKAAEFLKKIKMVEDH
jgi:hypothetical protein